ncbi:hypothetical protein HDU96_004206 [Phlyctochytrium bullatum]|nr:hypothetical protein HDU96_004206 [Phlyctochytrium bullatum]
MLGQKHRPPSGNGHAPSSSSTSSSLHHAASATTPDYNDHDDGEVLDQDTMRKRLQEFRRRKELERIKAKAAEKKKSEKAFVVPVPKKEVVPDVIGSILRTPPVPGAAPAPKPPVPTAAAAAAAAAARPKPAAATSRPVTRATAAARGAPKPAPSSLPTRKPVSAASSGAASLRSSAASSAAPGAGAAKNPLTAGVAGPRSHLPTSTADVRAAVKAGNVTKRGAGVGARVGGKAPVTKGRVGAAAAAGPTGQELEKYFINADTVRSFGFVDGVEERREERSVPVGGRGKQEVQGFRAFANPEPKGRAVARAPTAPPAMVSQATQTNEGGDDNDVWDLKTNLVQLFETADRRARTEQEKKVAAHCMRLVMSMVDVVIRGSPTTTASPSSGLQRLSAAKEGIMARIAAKRNSPVLPPSDSLPATRKSGAFAATAAASSSPMVANGVSVADDHAARGPAPVDIGLTPKLRPGRYMSSDKAKYTPHSDDDGEDVEDEEEEIEAIMAEAAPAGDVFDEPASAGSTSPFLGGRVEAAAPTSARSTGSARDRYEPTAPGVRQRVGHLEEDSEPLPPRSRFLGDMDVDEKPVGRSPRWNGVSESPELGKKPTAAVARDWMQETFTSQVPSGDGDDDDDEVPPPPVFRSVQAAAVVGSPARLLGAAGAASTPGGAFGRVRFGSPAIRSPALRVPVGEKERTSPESAGFRPAKAHHGTPWARRKGGVEEEDDGEEQQEMEGGGSAGKASSVGSLDALSVDPKAVMWQHRMGERTPGAAARRRDHAGHTPRPPLKSFDSCDEEEEEEEEDGRGEEEEEVEEEVEEEEVEVEEEEVEEEEEEEEEDEGVYEHAEEGDGEREDDDRFVELPRRRASAGTPRAAAALTAAGRRLSRRTLDDPSMRAIVSMLNGMQIEDVDAAAGAVLAQAAEAGAADDGLGHDGEGRPVSSARKSTGRVALRKDGHTEVRLGPSEVDAGSCTVLTPRRANKKEREEFGVEKVVTNARRSIRLFQNDVLRPDELVAVKDENAEPVEGVQQRVQQHLPPRRIGNMEPHEMDIVNQLLMENGMTFVPNKVVPTETLAAKPAGLLGRSSLANPLSAFKPMSTPAPSAAMEADLLDFTPTPAGGKTPRASTRAGGSVLTPGPNRVNIMDWVSPEAETASPGPLTRARQATLRAAAAIARGEVDNDATPKAR